MSYELFQQGPDVYVPVLFLTLITTVLAYGGFPFIFAKTRKNPITKGKYRKMCYGINIAVKCVFAVINGGNFNIGPYLLWTWVFTTYGTKVLIKRGVMVDETDESTETRDLKWWQFRTFIVEKP